MAAMVVFSLIVWSLVRNPAVSTVVFVVWKDVAVISPANVPPDAFDTVSVTANARKARITNSSLTAAPLPSVIVSPLLAVKSELSRCR